MLMSKLCQPTTMFLAAMLCAGCMPTAKSQLARCQSEKKQLLARIVDEQKRAETLTAENRGLNEKLADAETQLAKLHDGRGSRIAEFRRPNSTASPSPSSSSANSGGSSARFAPDLNSAITLEPIGKWRSKQSQRPASAARDDSSSR